MPTLGILVAGEPAEALRGLLVACARRVRLADAMVDGRAAGDAFLVSGDPVDVTLDAPVAVWIADEADVARPLAQHATVLITDSAELAEVAGARGVLVGNRAVGHAVPVSPWVRSRVRAARGLPDVLVVRLSAEERLRYVGVAAADLERVQTVELPHEALPSACAAASAVIATEPHALYSALSWAAPTVTDPLTAAALGVRDGVETVVAAGRESQLAAARDLAGDVRRAGAMGWAGRLFAERRDPEFAARAVLGRLFGKVDTDARTILRDTLDELNTPTDAAIRSRAAAFTAVLAETGVG